MNRTLANVLADLREPTPEDRREYRLTVAGARKDGSPRQRWMWAVYADGDFAKGRVGEACTAGYTIVLDERWIEEKTHEHLVLIRLRIYDPERPDRYVEAPGFGGMVDETGGKQAREKLWAGAMTQAIKRAAMKFGVGLDLHGEKGVWTDHHKMPNGTPCDDKGRPTGGRPRSGQRQVAKREEAPTPSNGEAERATVSGTTVTDWGKEFGKLCHARKVDPTYIRDLLEQAEHDHKQAYDLLVAELEDQKGE